jgi:hypothetical protein
MSEGDDHMQESDDILKHWGIKGMKWKKHKKKGIFSNALNIVKKYEHKTVKGLKKTGDNIKKYEHKTVKSFKKDSNIIKNYTHKTIKNLTKTQKQKDEEALQKYAKKHNLSKKQIEEQRAFLNRMRHPKKLNAESMAKLKTEVKISSPAGLKKHEKKHKKKHNKNDPYMSKADKDLLKELKKRGYKLVTDHRINLSLYKIEPIMNGDIDELLDALITADRAEKLQSSSDI